MLGADGATETDMVVENFQNMLTPNSQSKLSYRHSMPKSPQKKQSSKSIQLNLKPVQEQPSKKAAKREQFPQLEIVTGQQHKKLDKQQSDKLNRQLNTMISPKTTGQ